jgi:hypothetical protein
LLNNEKYNNNDKNMTLIELIKESQVKRRSSVDATSEPGVSGVEKEKE